MDDAPRSPLNTREFAVRWNTIVEQHFATKLAESLGRLAAAQPGGVPLHPEQCAVLAHHMVQALHLAASPAGGGVEEAVRYLVRAAAEGEGVPHDA